MANKNEEKIETLKRIVDNLQYSITKYGEVYANVIEDNYSKTILVKSKEFQNWILSKYIQESDDINIPSSVQKCMENYIEVIARKKGVLSEVFVRVGKDEEGNMYHNLANKLGQLVKITQDKVEIVSDVKGVIFTSNPQVLEMPLPNFDTYEEENLVEMIKKFVNLKGSKLLLLVVLVIYLLIPGVKYPIGGLMGPKRAGKGTLARLLFKLIDPNLTGVDGQVLQNNVSDLLISIKNRHLVIFDNISEISNKISDIFCNIQSGTIISKRALFTDNEVMTLQIMKPLCFTSTTNPLRREDLIDRTIIIDFKESQINPIADSLIEKTMDEYAPKIRAEMYMILSKAMKIVNTVEVADIDFRCSDFLMWGQAICMAMSISVESFIKALNENSTELNHDFAESDKLMELILSYTEKWSIGDTKELSVSEWKIELSKYCKMKGFSSTEFERRENAISRALMERKTNLNKFGIQVERKKSGKRSIIIRKFRDYSGS